MLTGLLVLSLAIMCSGAAAAAVASTTRTERQQQASNTWRLIALRNGVGAEIPFGNLGSDINAPGMVEILPSRMSPPPLSDAPVPAACPLETPPTMAFQPVESSDGARKLAPSKGTEIRFGYPQGCYSTDLQDLDALNVLHRLISEGETRKTALSWAVFGGSGGKVYSNAKPIIEKALKTNAK